GRPLGRGIRQDEIRMGAHCGGGLHDRITARIAAENVDGSSAREGGAATVEDLAANLPQFGSMHAAMPSITSLALWARAVACQTTPVAAAIARVRRALLITGISISLTSTTTRPSGEVSNAAITFCA